MALREFIAEFFDSETSDSRLGNWLSAGAVVVESEEKFVLHRVITKEEAVCALEKHFGKSAQLREWDWVFKQSDDQVSVVMIGPIEDQGYTYFWVWHCRLEA